MVCREIPGEPTIRANDASAGLQEASLMFLWVDSYKKWFKVVVAALIPKGNLHREKYTSGKLLLHI